MEVSLAEIEDKTLKATEAPTGLIWTWTEQWLQTNELHKYIKLHKLITIPILKFSNKIAGISTY